MTGFFGVEFRCGPTGKPRLSQPCDREQAKEIKSELEAEGYLCRIVFYPSRFALQIAIRYGSPLPMLHRAAHIEAQAA